ncbi:hypothetical protein ABB02_01774 [Clostridiaceae bacterium JG1575]|nr:hypothetical protein ABB02_01774 [Clostridiaceae bacterium JG1575]
MQTPRPWLLDWSDPIPRTLSRIDWSALAAGGLRIARLPNNRPSLDRSLAVGRLKILNEPPRPMLGPWPSLQQSAAADGWEECLKRESEPMDLLLLGAFTTLAQILAGDPQVKERIHCVYCTGGALYGAGQSARGALVALNDPESAQLVLRSGVKLCWIPQEVLGEASPLALLMTLREHPEWFQGAPCAVDVDLCGRLTRGLMVWDLLGTTGRPPNVWRILGFSDEARAHAQELAQTLLGELL